MITNYSLIFLAHLPWLLLLAGAILRTRRQPSRLRRLQVAGPVLLLLGIAGTLFLFDPNFGRDPYRVGNWSWFFQRMEPGVFWIGLLTFGLGYFLDRRPRPGLRPWSLVGKVLSVLAILVGGVVAYISTLYVSAAWISWDADRLIFVLGFYPFAVIYLVRGLAGEETPIPAEPDT